MNYTELQAYVLAEVEDYSTEIVANFANLTRQAENKIQFELELPAQQANDLGNMTQGNRFLQTPNDFLAAYSVFIVTDDGRKGLLPKDTAFIYEAFPDITDEGEPRFYAIYNDSALLIGPTPDDDYEVELSYFQMAPSIVDDSTSWLGDNAEALLANAVILEAYKFIKAVDKVPVWEAEYKQALARMKNYSEGITQRDDYRDGQIRITPT